MTKPNNKTLGHIQSDIDNNKSNKKKDDYKENKESNNIKSLVPKRNNYKIGKKTNHRSKPSIPKAIEKTKKSTIPKKLREEIWNHYNEGQFTAKCHVPWCNRNIDVFNFHVGHDIPECKGGSHDIINLKPICSNCNLSMGYRFTISDWSKLKLKKEPLFKKIDVYKLSFSIVSMVSMLLNIYQFNNMMI